MLEKIRQYRVNVLTLTLYDWVPIPLVNIFSKDFLKIYSGIYTSC